MALIPFAEHKLISPPATDPRITPRVGILHVDAANAYDLYAYFNGRSGGVESHFHIPKDGTLFQYRDTGWQADANYLANDFAISVETQGLGTGQWTDAQLGMIKRVMLWCKDVHGIPLRKCPEWDASGWGYHIQFGTPGKWTNVAKACPGNERIEQFHDVLVPWMKNAGEVEPKPNRVRQAHDLLDAAARKTIRATRDITDAVALLEGVDEERKVIHRRLPNIAQLVEQAVDLKRAIREAEANFPEA